MWPPALSSTPAEHGGNYRRGSETHTHARAHTHTPRAGENPGPAGERSLAAGRGEGGSTAGAHRHSDPHTRYSALRNLGDVSFRELGTNSKKVA